jgi:hypothetical protein
MGFSFGKNIHNLWRKLGEKKGLNRPAKTSFCSIQKLGWEKKGSHIWGYKTEQLSEFSTIRPVYPQFKGTYPQFRGAAVWTGAAYMADHNP